jgi:hypothetical protein
LFFNSFFRQFLFGQGVSCTLSPVMRTLGYAPYISLKKSRWGNQSRLFTDDKEIYEFMGVPLDYSPP